MFISLSFSLLLYCISRDYILKGLKFREININLSKCHAELKGKKRPYTIRELFNLDAEKIENVIV